MRLAFIDLVFSWPPLGGAPADLYYTMEGLRKLGHEPHLFFAADPAASGPGDRFFWGNPCDIGRPAARQRRQ